MNMFIFHNIWDVILPIDDSSIIFQRGRAQPPTSYSYGMLWPLPVIIWDDIIPSTKVIYHLKWGSPGVI